MTWIGNSWYGDSLIEGGKTGFVRGSDTHDGKPAARTAVLATALTRPAIFEALRHRRNYAVSNARIRLDFRINGHFMGEEIEVHGKPRIVADIQGTDMVEEVVVVRVCRIIRTWKPRTKNVQFEYEKTAASWGAATTICGSLKRTRMNTATARRLGPARFG